MTNRQLLYLVIILVVIVMAVYIAKNFVLNKYFALPVNGRISSPFGERASPTEGASTSHNGVDIVATIDTPIKAKFDGEPIAMYSDSKGGIQLIVEHNGGWRSGYAHLNRYGNIQQGKKFKAGDIIAYTGNTGNTTGAHLHYTLTNPQGVKVDPEKYIGKKLV